MTIKYVVKHKTAYRPKLHGIFFHVKKANGQKYTENILVNKK